MNFLRNWLIHEENIKNSSTVKPALRINALKVPTESSLCCGIERFTQTPGFTITRWLPTWPIEIQPALSKALAASLPEILLSFPMG